MQLCHQPAGEMHLLEAPTSRCSIVGRASFAKGRAASLHELAEPPNTHAGKRVVLRSLSTLVHPWLLVLLSLACHMLLPAQLLFWHPLLRRVLHLLNLALFTLGH